VVVPVIMVVCAAGAAVSRINIIIIGCWSARGAASAALQGYKLGGIHLKSPDITLY